MAKIAIAWASALAVYVPAAAIAAMGAVVIAGWLTGEPRWRVPIPGSTTMVFSTAVGFVIAAIGLAVAYGSRSPRGNALRNACAAFLAFIGVVALAEHVFGLPGLVDFPGLHGNLDPANPAPGRMSPPTAVSFMLTGALLAAFDRPTDRARAMLLQVMTGLLLALGIVSSVAWDIDPESLLPWYRYTRMALPTALGFIAIGIAVLALIARTRWYEEVYARREDEKILILTMGILMLVCVTIGAAGFATMQHHLTGAIRGSLGQAVTDRSVILQSILSNRVTRASIVASRPSLQDLLQQYDGRDNAVLQARIRAEGESYLGSGFRGLSFQDEHGRAVAQVGTLSEEPPIRVVLRGLKAEASLLWDGEYLLRVFTPVYRGFEWVGTVVTEQELDLVTRLQLEVKELGDTAEWVLCAAAGPGLACFPQRYETMPRIQPRATRAPLPVELALAGQHGVTTADDYRGKRVIAGYTPVGTTALGVVLKVDADEFYAPLRRQLSQWLQLFFAIALAGSLLVASQVRPVAQRLVHSERLARTRSELLERSEKSLRELYAALGDGIVVLSAAGDIEFANPAAERIFGYGPGELAGKPVGVLMPEKLRDANASATQEYLRGSASSVVGKRGLVYPALRRDGTPFDVEFSLAEMREDTGVRLVAVVRDVSERTALERMKGEFVAAVSHELRTPLTSIIGSLEILREEAGSLPEAERGFLDMACRNAERLATLVNDVIDSERIESGALKFDESRFELEPFLREAVELNQPYAGAHHVTLVLEQPVPPVALHADRGRIMQVMANLISNAAKFSAAGHSVRVRTQMRGENVRIEVIDTGRGIPEEFRARVFEKFAQADASDAREKGGTGLGLAICKAIVERSRGTIGYESRLGAGTTFWIELPSQS